MYIISINRRNAKKSPSPRNQTDRAQHIHSVNSIKRDIRREFFKSRWEILWGGIRYTHLLTPICMNFFLGVACIVGSRALALVYILIWNLCYRHKLVLRAETNEGRTWFGWKGTTCRRICHAVRSVGCVCMYSRLHENYAHCFTYLADLLYMSDGVGLAGNNLAKSG